MTSARRHVEPRGGVRVAIVNDQRLAIEALRRVLRQDPAYEVAWVAADGAEAVARAAADRPDVILMDLLMPVMDGVEATRRIMRDSPCAILVVTATVSGNASLVFQAMGHGALDATSTPVLGLSGLAEGGDPLLLKLRTIARLIGANGTGPARPDPTVLPPPGRGPSVVLVGASTGGPKALSEVLAALPPGFAAPIVAVQHVDAQFAPGLAKWLGGLTPLEVVLAADGDPLRPGRVHVAGTNDHLVLAEDGRLRYTPLPADLAYRPSVDVLFRSFARRHPGPGVGVLLTGMGKDGAQGLLELRGRGWHTIAQDRATSVVYGMPKAAAELGAAVEVLGLPDVAAAIQAGVRS